MVSDTNRIVNGVSCNGNSGKLENLGTNGSSGSRNYNHHDDDETSGEDDTLVLHRRI